MIGSLSVCTITFPLPVMTKAGELGDDRRLADHIAAGGATGCRHRFDLPIREENPGSAARLAFHLEDGRLGAVYLA
jgi:hypothetical protein